MRKQALAVCMAAMLAGSMMAGCGTTKNEEVSDSTNSTQSIQEEAQMRTVTDSDGNEIFIPKEVTKAAPAIGAFAQVTEMLLNGNGKISAAATQQITDDFKNVFTDYTKSNPNNYDSSSVEELVASGTQVVYGPSSAYSEEQLQQMKDAGIAFVNIANLSNSESIMDSFRLIGEILGEDEAQRAEEFCKYYQESIDDCQSRTKDLSDDEKVNVLKLNVSGGSYTTVNNTDIFSSIVSEAGGINLAADYEVSGGEEQTSGKGGGGRSGISVDAEQIVKWDPDIIITNSKESADAIKTDPALASVAAVQDGNVYNSPQGLYLWGVRSGENAMMTPWLGQIMYPELYSDIEMTSVVKDFYKTWYNTEITDEQAETVLAGK